MPYTSDKIAINNPELDRRRKLQQEDYENIKSLYKDGMAIRAITRVYGVSRRLIQYIIFPERQKKTKSMDYYTKEKNAKYQREHRRYKHLLYKHNLIGGDSNEMPSL